MNKMKIVWLTNNINQMGGIEQVICGLSNYFSEALGYSVEIISINSSQSNIFYTLNESVYVKHCCIDWREQTFLKLVAHVGNIMSNLDADYLITCHPTISYAALLNKRKFNGKVIVTQHSASESFSKKRLYCNAVMFRFADKFVVLNKTDQDIYKKLGCSSIVIPNANFRFVNNRSSLNNKTILAVGRLEKVKGFDFLLESFSMVAPAHPDWKVCICGGGSCESQLKKQAVDLGISEQVVFPGAVKNMEDYFMQTSVFALSSRSEGFPLVLLEAMSFGIPVVSFNLSAPEKILSDGGGFIVEFGNVSEFAKKLDLLMSDNSLCKQMGDEAYTSSGKYSVSEISEHWKNLFCTLKS